MNGKIDAFYGAEVVDDDGQAIGSLLHKTVVDVLESFGKPANQVGEWVKVGTDSMTGWVLSSQVHAPYRGGARPGAGRKPLGGTAKVRVTVTLPAALVAKATELGGGNTSAGVEMALARKETILAVAMRLRDILQFAEDDDLPSDYRSEIARAATSLEEIDRQARRKY